VSAADVEELLTGPGGLHVDRLDLVTPAGQANRDNRQVGGTVCGWWEFPTSGCLAIWSWHCPTMFCTLWDSVNGCMWCVEHD
jgi:hypothetical protein